MNTANQQVDLQPLWYIIISAYRNLTFVNFLFVNAILMDKRQHFLFTILLLLSFLIHVIFLHDPGNPNIAKAEVGPQNLENIQGGSFLQQD